MKRLDRKFVRLSLAVGLAALISGCGPSKPADPNAGLPPLPTGAEMGSRAGEARKLALEFELAAGELQNAPLTRQRPQLKTLFGQLTEVLPRLAGPLRTGVFNHQYAVVVQVRDQIANRPERLSDDALVDNGLLASYNALRDLSYTQFYVDEDLTKRMEALAASVGRLPLTKGVDHAIQVSDAVTATSAVLTKMAGTLYDRNKELDAGAEPSPATQPAATQPSAPPPADPAAPAPAPSAPGQPTPAPAPAPSPVPAPTEPPASPAPAPAEPAPTAPAPAEPAPATPAQTAPPGQ
ncbi:hypothetical protein [Humisphaera borealis]|uniref:Lipoprotein n=1 Tax=Humisphaera borealis TaxID=2807512 RepID=A0A7M2X1B2_9BACT|nr:hypothetical protein [Humisphaera borealis]QOV91537.1 hypothetical protein IPV69_09330 [Humisphaera borealis]